MKLNILYHHRTQGRGAEGVHITSIVRALQAMGHSVTVLSPPGVDPLDSRHNAPVDKSRVKTGGIQTLWKWISRHMPNFLFELAEIGYNLPAWWRLRRMLAAQKFDLIYERYAFFLVAGAVLARQHGIPFVLEANEVSGIAHRARPQSYPRLCSWFERFLFARCAGIHTVSSRLKQMILSQRVPDGRVHVVPNAFDVAKIKTHGKNPELIGRYHLQNKLVLGFAGWFDHWDRLDFFVDVFRELRNTHDNLHLLLIGDGPVLAEVRKLIARDDLTPHVTLTGPVTRNKIYDYLSLIDIAVLPHSNDFGSPVVMFEFMGLKIPVVAPRLPPIMDVHTNGKTGMLFDPLDVAQCRQAIEQLVMAPELRHQIAQWAYQKLQSDHTWHRNAALILESAGLPSAP
jgi:glycosyltransferase involved in cell wall biosynthesis